MRVTLWLLAAFAIDVMNGHGRLSDFTGLLLVAALFLCAAQDLRELFPSRHQ